MAVTTIQIDASTRERLARLKSSPRQTYDEVLNRILAILPDGDEEGKYTDAFCLGLLEARLDIRAGRLIDHDELKKRLAIR
jgi:predicted transcriptional regulator